MSSEKLDNPGLMEVTGKILIATIIALFLVLVVVFCFHIYARWLWQRRRQGMDITNNRRRQDHHSGGVTVLRRGLDAAFLKTLPVSQFDIKDFKDGLECSVCLSELEQGEKTRILPKCNHVFHADCIDMWFHSHSTCPICRNPVSDDQPEVSVESLIETQQAESTNSSGESQSHSFPTNVLFWGDETEVSTLTSQLEEANNHQQATDLHFEPASSSSSQTNNDRFKPDLVIDIPRQMGQVEVSEEEDEKTPIMSGMRSLRRILSSSRRFNPFSPGNNNAVAEQVTAGQS